MGISGAAQDLFHFLPEGTLIAAALFVLLLDPLLPPKRRPFLGGLAVLGLVLSAFFVWHLWGRSAFVFGRLYLLDPYALFFKSVFLGTALITLLVSFRYLTLSGIPQGEYLSLILFALVGMMVTAAGVNLLSIYLGLELMTISSYALVGLIKRERASLEGALKYFILGAFNSGVILYGIALLYGSTGTTGLSGIAEAFAENGPSLLSLFATALLLAGFFFKISAFPFHMWVPDAYEGSPTPVAGFISVASKAAGFAALLRITVLVLPALLWGKWQLLVILLAVLTMTVGNLLALSQESLKRMLAYSSIAHAGYLLIGVAAGTPLGTASVLFYFLAYGLMNLGAFAMIVLLVRRGYRAESLEDFRGLAKRHPLWGFCFLIFLLSLAGIPPSAGFIGKFYLFAAAIEAGLYTLAVIGVVNSVLALFYYFRVAQKMYMIEAPKPFELSPSWGLRFSLVLLAGLTLLAGLYPVPFLQAAREAAQSLL